MRVLILSLLLPVCAVGHPMDKRAIQTLDPTAPAQMDIGVRPEGRGFRVGFLVDLKRLMDEAHPPEEGEAQQPWTEARPLFERYARKLVSLHAGEEALEAKVSFPHLERSGQFSAANDTTKGDFVDMFFAVSKEKAPITLTVNALVKTAVVGVIDRHTPRKIPLKEGDAHQVVLRGALAPAALAETSKALAEVSAASTLWHYLKQGVVHIIPRGLDHILFVLGLLLFSTRWRPLLIQISLFTVAHTLTLALSTLGVIQLTPWVTEVLIALSITYVAVENLVHEELTKLRMAVVFGFGLLHGLGFAGVLGELGLSGSHFVLSLLGFNIGVELGQLAVVAGGFALVFWARERDFYRPWIVRPGSIAIGLCGLWWAFERWLQTGM